MQLRQVTLIWHVKGPGLNPKPSPTNKKEKRKRKIVTKTPGLELVSSQKLSRNSTCVICFTCTTPQLVALT